MKEEKFPAGSIIGVGWGRAVREVIATGLPHFPGVRAVALNGGMQASAAHFQINEFVRQAAEQLGGSAHFLHAPYLSSSELRDAFLKDPSSARRQGYGNGSIVRWSALACPFLVGGDVPSPDEPSMGRRRRRHSPLLRLERHHPAMGRGTTNAGGFCRAIPADKALGRFGRRRKRHRLSSAQRARV